MKITLEQLHEIYPHARGAHIKTFLPFLNKYLPLYGMDNCKRVAAYLGQMGHECAQFNFLEEQQSKYNTAPGGEPYALYDGRKATLGNYVIGDGKAYRGRGLVMLTGRFNYGKYGNKLSLPLLTKPELAGDPECAVRISLEYWKENNLNSHADAWNLTRITEIINGKAKLGLKERQDISNRALKVLTPKEISDAKEDKDYIRAG